MGFGFDDLVGGVTDQVGATFGQGTDAIGGVGDYFAQLDAADRERLALQGTTFGQNELLGIEDFEDVRNFILGEAASSQSGPVQVPGLLTTLEGQMLANQAGGLFRDQSGTAQSQRLLNDMLGIQNPAFQVGQSNEDLLHSKGGKARATDSRRFRNPNVQPEQPTPEQAILASIGGAPGLREQDTDVGGFAGGALNQLQNQSVSNLQGFLNQSNTRNAGLADSFLGLAQFGIPNIQNQSSSDGGTGGLISLF